MVQTFGVTVEVSAPAGLMEAVRSVLPPRAVPATDRPALGCFALLPSGRRGLVDLRCDGASFSGICDVALALGMLDSQMRLHIASSAPDHVFVHAGVVGVGGRAIVLPGRSFAGKTTLVAALVQVGAQYWSDEYAVLDADGLVHPYAKPLSIRGPDLQAEDHTVESLGGRAGEEPLSVALIALTHYRPGAAWAPERSMSGVGAIKMLEHAVPARARPEQSLAAVRRAADGALVLLGERGEAEEAAAALIAEVSRTRVAQEAGAQGPRTHP